jgi:hypothetical protein
MKKYIKNALAIIVFISCAYSAQPMAPALYTTAALFEELKTAITANRTCYKKLIKLLRLNSDQGIITTSHLSTIKCMLSREKTDMDIKNKREEKYFAHVLDYISHIYQTQAPELATTQCSICMENVQSNSIVLTCKHAFCYECLFNWFTQHDTRKTESVNTKCPICRREFAPHIKQLFTTDHRFTTQSAKRLKEIQEEEEQQTLHPLIQLFQLLGISDELPNNTPVIIQVSFSTFEH